MKKILFLFCCLIGLNSVWGQGMTIPVSTGIDSLGQPLPDSAVDPHWWLSTSPGVGVDTTARVVPYLGGQWQSAPVLGSNAKWINRSGSIGGLPAGVYVYERSFDIPPGTIGFQCDFNIAFDDSLVVLELVDPSHNAIPLPVIPIDTYRLSYPVSNSIGNPDPGTWKLRMTTYHWDPIGGMLVTGYIHLYNAPPPISCCDSSIVTNGTFSQGFIANDGSITGCNAQFPNSYMYNWCGIEDPQVTYLGGPYGYGMAFWGVGQNFASGEGIYQQVDIVQGQRYKVCFDAKMNSFGAVFPASSTLRFKGGIQAPTDNQDGQLIEDVALSHFDMHQESFYWMANADYTYLIITVHNSIPTNDSSLATWAWIDNLCIEPVPTEAQNCCDTTLIRNGDFSQGILRSNSNLACPDSPGLSYQQHWCKVGSPQYALSDHPYNACIGLWGVGTQFSAGEGIHQAVSLVQDKTYHFCLDLKWIDLRRMGPQDVTIRFCAHNSSPIGNSCFALMGEVTSTSTEWGHFEFTWTADANYPYLAITAHNSSPIDDGEYISYALIDNICAIVDTTVVGLGETRLPMLRLFPNPTMEILTVEFPEALGLSSSVEVVDDLGRIIPLRSVNRDIGISTLDVSALPNGHYNLRVSFVDSALTLHRGFVKI